MQDGSASMTGGSLHRDCALSFTPSAVLCGGQLAVLFNLYVVPLGVAVRIPRIERLRALCSTTTALGSKSITVVSPLVLCY
jgi:hypothetical protein